MSEYKKTISRDDYYRALALFTVAHDHYMQATKFGEALNKIIMQVPEKYPGGHVDDGIYSDEPVSVAEFDERLQRQGIEVVDAEAQ